MKEIGGYLGLDDLLDNEYYKDKIALNSGRNALLYLMRAKKIMKLYLPYYLCDSVSSIIKKNGYDLEYYHIDTEFCPIFEKTLKKDEYIYIVNYYGQFTNNRILDLYKEYKNIIIDNTHAFFQSPIAGIDTIYSCRKFFGVPDGAYLSTDTLLNELLDIDISQDRMTHILGRFEGMASDYYKCFQKNDSAFKYESLKHMSKLTKNILGAIDYKRVRKTRDENYAYLESRLSKLNKLKLNTPRGAFSYPLYVENCLDIREILVGKKIYIPTIWPNVLNQVQQESIEYQYTKNILPLPCDQRYGEEDMNYLIEEIYKCIS